MKKHLMAFGAALLLSVGGLQARTFTWSASSDALSMDPYSTNNTFTNAFMGNIYEGLVRFNDKVQIEPALAESWSALSPTLWRFKLRRGVKFHNGEAMTADDVVFSWQRVMTPGSIAKMNLGDVKDVRKVDAFTVDVETRAPFPLLLNELLNLVVMSRSWCEKNKATQASDLKQKKENHANRSTNGTGPFMLKSRAVDVRTVLVANPDWWDKPGHNLSEVVFTPIQSDATRTSSLLSGALDASVSVPLQDTQRIGSSGAFTVVQGPELRTIFLGMDQFRDELLYSGVKGRNPFKDLRVRKALYQAIDVEAIKRSVMRGQSWPAGMILSPLLNGAPRELNTRLLPFHAEAAKKLLAEAGYPEGFAVGMQCPNNRYVYDEQICLAIVSMLGRVGIRVTPQLEPMSKFHVRLNTMDVSLYMIGHAGLPMADAYAQLFDTLATRSDTQGGLNAGRYSNPALDALLPKIATELDSTRRSALIAEVVAIARNDFAYLPLHQQPVTWAARKGVDLRQGPDNQLRLWLVSVPG
ncbi:ABC transporter substrate-binding protein [Verminephrobacter aporrectodeae]|uniref:ABC transporter substrate-binding protein n=1 Tax=Verminephrobacter aporrectodeae TaxID=1110389 RepID=UPI002244470F|nr:ABC transporter substrate-binding protein [Verminephrobacter aporrectodeae]MCW8176504.1 ABC transporter substrate-binding protein [Verminephrobacter aporrectodeae subsp. tuberculatae]MCW8204223.1 ABC transporter substrate-binding protein [Verminephrobacter aporrectodeae subsp. tuberculatae]